MSHSTSSDYVWLHMPDDGQWCAFPTADQEILERAFQAQRPLLVTVQGGLMEVNMDDRQLNSRYWNQPPERVLRSLWFHGGLPYEECHSAILEEWYTNSSSSSVTLESLDVQVVRNEGEIFTEVDDVHTERPVMRGGAFKPAVSPLCITGPIECLVLTVHGIGETLWSKQRFRQRGLIQYTSLLREQVHQQTAAADASRSGRMEFIPIEWYQLLHDHNAELTGQLASITLPSIPLLRTFSNEAVADVLFYTSDAYRPKILAGVAFQLNRIVDLFFGYNPLVPKDIPISVIGHSLGSVIMYDLLCCQSDPNLHRSLKLDFTPHCCFFLGSPLGLFLTVRGMQLENVNPFPTGIKFYNVMHATDPVAYRMEPLLVRDAANLPPKHVPHHLDGGFRAHVKVKNVIAQLWKVPGELFGSSGQGLKGALEVANNAIDIMNSKTAELPDNISYEQIEAAVVQLLGHRVDWVLQDETLSAAITNAYISAMASHCGYFQHPDVAGFVMNMTGFLEFKKQMGLDGNVPEAGAPRNVPTVEVTTAVVTNVQADTGAE